VTNSRGHSATAELLVPTATKTGIKTLHKLKTQTTRNLNDGVERWSTKATLWKWKASGSVKSVEATNTASVKRERPDGVALTYTARKRHDINAGRQW